MTSSISIVGRFYWLALIVLASAAGGQWLSQSVPITQLSLWCVVAAACLLLGARLFRKQSGHAQADPVVVLSILLGLVLISVLHEIVPGGKRSGETTRVGVLGLLGHILIILMVPAVFVFTVSSLRFHVRPHPASVSTGGALSLVTIGGTIVLLATSAVLLGWLVGAGGVIGLATAFTIGCVMPLGFAELSAWSQLSLWRRFALAAPPDRLERAVRDLGMFPQSRPPWEELIVVASGAPHAVHCVLSFSLIRGPRLVFSQDYLDRLSDGELRAVLCHEIGHIVHNHHRRALVQQLQLTAAVMVATVAGVIVVRTLQPAAGGWLLGAAVGAVLLVPRLLYSLSRTRTFEREADDFALRVASPRELVSALEQLRGLQPNREDMPQAWTSHGTWAERRARIERGQA